MKRTWMMAAVSERGGPAGQQEATLRRVTHRQTHRCTQPFIPFGAVWRLAAALWRRLIAPLGLPSSAGCASRWDHCRPVRHLLCWPHRLSPQPSDGSAPAGVMAEPARLSTLSALHSAAGLPSLCAGSRCVAGRSSQRRTTLTPYFAPPPMHSSPLIGPASPSFALDFAGILSVNGKRCWSL